MVSRSQEMLASPRLGLMSVLHFYTTERVLYVSQNSKNLLAKEQQLLRLSILDNEDLITSSEFFGSRKSLLMFPFFRA